MVIHLTITVCTYLQPISNDSDSAIIDGFPEITTAYGQPLASYGFGVTDRTLRVRTQSRGFHTLVPHAPECTRT